MLSCFEGGSFMTEEWLENAWSRHFYRLSLKEALKITRTTKRKAWEGNMGFQVQFSHYQIEVGGRWSHLRLKEKWCNHYNNNEDNFEGKVPPPLILLLSTYYYYFPLWMDYTLLFVLMYICTQRIFSSHFDLQKIHWSIIALVLD